MKTDNETYITFDQFSNHSAILQWPSDMPVGKPI